MNSLKIKANKVPGPDCFVSGLKKTKRKNPIEVRQFLLISRIMISIFTIGLLGHTLDRVMRVFKKP